MRSHPADTPRVALLVTGDRGLHLDAERDWIEHAKDAQLQATIRVLDGAHELGFCGALKAGMHACRASEAVFDYVFHLGEDYRFEAAFSVTAMATVLDAHAAVFQVALKPEAVPGETPVMEDRPAAFKPHTIHPNGERPVAWLEHDLFYTATPNLIRRTGAAILDELLPATSCDALGRELVERRWRFAYLGHAGDAPLVGHVAPRRH